MYIIDNIDISSDSDRENADEKNQMKKIQKYKKLVKIFSNFFFYI